MSCAGCPCHVTDPDQRIPPDCLADGKCIEMEEEMIEQPKENRVRMNFGMNTRGLVQMDLTVEFPTVGQAETEARKAIDAYRTICAEKGLKLVEPTA